jgi:tungstate transport system permease protein
MIPPRVEDLHNDTMHALETAIGLVLSGDAALRQIVGLSLAVSLSAVALATMLGLPLGAAVALGRFPGRNALIVALNALMGLPPVVVGLAVYLLLSRAGPLGELGLLFTPSAMVIAQAVLVLPIIAALTRQTVEDLWAEYGEQLVSLGVGSARAVPTLLWDGRYGVMTAVLAGLGRAAAEVGAILIVGGNIAGVTRTMTTAIALETSKGELGLALALGLILIALVLMINAAAFALTRLSTPTH